MFRSNVRRVQSVVFFCSTRRNIFDVHKNLWADGSEEQSELEKTVEKWGWYHILCDAVETKLLGNTLFEVEKVVVGEFLHHLSYQKDMAYVRKKQMEGAKGRRVH